MGGWVVLAHASRRSYKHRAALHIPKILVTATTLSYLPAVRKSLSFDPLTDFTPIGRAAEVAFFLYASADLRVKDVSQLAE